MNRRIYLTNFHSWRVHIFNPKFKQNCSHLEQRVIRKDKGAIFLSVTEFWNYVNNIQKIKLEMSRYKSKHRDMKTYGEVKV
jgi:uncharacterized membrane protein